MGNMMVLIVNQINIERLREGTMLLNIVISKWILPHPQIGFLPKILTLYICLTHTFFEMFMNVMVSFHCQPDTIYNHLSLCTFYQAGSIGRSMRDYLDYVNWGGKTHTHYGWHHSLGRASELYTRESKLMASTHALVLCAFDCARD